MGGILLGFLFQPRAVFSLILAASMKTEKAKNIITQILFSSKKTLCFSCNETAASQNVCNAVRSIAL